MSSGKLNTTNYKYEKGQEVLIPAHLLHDIINYLSAVQAKETVDGYKDFYSISGQEVKTDDDLVINVQEELQEYPSAQSWFSQPPQKLTTMYGVMALDLGMQFTAVHNKYIEQGLAKPYGEFDIQTEEKPVIKLT